MQVKNFKNYLLVAMPSQDSEFFDKSVVLVYEHSKKTGAIGFTINKPLSATLSNVLEHLTIPVVDKTIEDRPVYSGGPIGPDQGFVLHDDMVLAESSKDKEITISTSREILKDIGEGGGPEHFMVVLGYAGWEPGQLEQEVQDNLWLVVPLQKKLIFDVPIPNRWATAAQTVGVDFNRLSSHTGHA